VHSFIFRIGPPAASLCVLRDQILLDKFVELVQVDVTENRGNHAALRASAQRFAVLPVFQVPGFKHVTDKPQEPLVVNFLRQYPEKDLMAETAGAVGDIAFGKPRSPGPGIADFPQCGVASASFAEPMRQV
jgi:hypothetical protein